MHTIRDCSDEAGFGHYATHHPLLIVRLVLAFTVRVVLITDVAFGLHDVHEKDGGSRYWCLLCLDNDVLGWDRPSAFPEEK